MKTLAPLLLAAFCAASHAQTAQTNDAVQDITPATFQIVQRAPDSRVWQRSETVTNAAGRVRTKLHQVTELTTGLNYLGTNGELLESKELIEAVPGGAVARQGRHSVAFADNLNTPEAVVLHTPDGQRLASRVLGLALYDSASDSSILIAETKDCTGQIVGSNQVLYADAFTGEGGFSADVVYINTRAGLEQNIVVRTRPPDPSQWNMSPQSTVLQVLTEFTNSSSPIVTETAISGPDGPLPDQHLAFGTMTMGPGRAFNLGETRRFGSGVPVGKSWNDLEGGRHILVEQVSYSSVATYLQNLPAPDPAVAHAVRPASRGKAFLSLGTPVSRPADLKPAAPMQLARLDDRQPGVVLDYTLMASATNFTFQGDTTYYVSGPVDLSGTTRIEGGAVIKFAPADASYLQLFGPLDCQTGPYRPAIFTASDDDSVGEIISGSTGAPSGYYAAAALMFNGMTSAVSVAYIRVSYADYGCVFLDNSNHVVANSQFIKCDVPLSVTGQACARNLLITQPQYALAGGVINGENLTVADASHLIDPSTVTLTNSLLVNVTNLGSFTGAYNATNTGNATFQTVGAGAYYLASSSPYRDTGTTNINPSFLADLRQKTTYPPVFYHDLSFTNDTVWSPTAQRDTDAPDCGYHYEPIDIMVSNVTVWDASLTLTDGVVLSASPVYGCSGCSSLFLYTTFVSQGTPFNPNRIAFCNTVQEGGSASDQNAQFILNSGADQWDDFHQTGFYALGSTPEIFAFTGSGVASFRDCSFWSGTARFYTGDTTLINLTNCFWHRASLRLTEDMFPMTNNVLNNTFIGGYVQFDSDEGGTPVENVQNNLFDQTAIDGGAAYPGDCSHNAYVTNYPRASAASDLILTNFTYQTGPLGDYYLPASSPLINAGTTTADQLGLYHYTTTTNQAQEGTSIIDIGCHYPAVDAATNPADSDGDGVADIIEDPNGNGFYDPDEPGNWQYNDGLPVYLSLGSGPNQTFTSGNYVITPLIIMVSDSNAVPLPGTPLTFVVTNGLMFCSDATNGTLSTNLTLWAGADGQVTVWLFLTNDMTVTNSMTITGVNGTNVTQGQWTAQVSGLSGSGHTIQLAGLSSTGPLPSFMVTLDWLNYDDAIHPYCASCQPETLRHYATNDLWLEPLSVTNTGGNYTYNLVIHTPTTNSPYDIFGTTNLTTNVTGLNLTNWVWFFTTTSGQTNISVTTNWPAAGFFMLGATNDADADGLSDAYEGLVSHTLTTNADTDNDGFSDGQEVALGMNPLTGDDSQQPGSRFNYNYDPVGRLRSVSGIRSETLTNDPEGNVLQDSH